MCVCLGFVQSELGPADNDLDLMGNPEGDKSVQSEGARHSVDDGQHVRAKVLLERRVFVEVVEHNLRHSIPLENYDQPLPCST